MGNLRILFSVVRFRFLGADVMLSWELFQWRYSPSKQLSCSFLFYMHRCHTYGFFSLLQTMNYSFLYIIWMVEVETEVLPGDG